MTDKQFVVTDAQLQRIYASGAAYSMEKARDFCHEMIRLMMLTGDSLAVAMVLAGYFNQCAQRAHRQADPPTPTKEES